MKTISFLTGILLNVNILISLPSNAQQSENKNISRLRFASSHTAFPDSARALGLTYEGNFFDAANHYNDSTVLIIIPNGSQQLKTVELVFWFHGWNNSIDSANVFFQLEEQFIASHKNAILVLTETAKNAPDSYGGKLEQQNVFAGLVNDVLNALKKNMLISNEAKAGKITLAGHSGAYRIIAYILAYGGVPVREVELFDALYSQVDKFTHWIHKDNTNRFIHWYTSHGGGTDEVSLQMMDTLKRLNIPFIKAEEKNTGAELLQSGRILFIHSEREHNDIINHPANFKLLLMNSNHMSDR